MMNNFHMICLYMYRKKERQGKGNKEGEVKWKGEAEGKLISTCTRKSIHSQYI